MPPLQTVTAPVAVPAPPIPQAPASPPVAVGSSAPQAATGTPAQVYEGLREQREVLGDQKSRILDEREDIVQQLRQAPASDTDRAGLEQRLAQVDQRLAQISLQIAEVDAQVAAAAAVPGAVVEEPPSDPWANGPPTELVALGMVTVAVLMLPVVLAWARRLWRRAAVVPAVPPELMDRMGNLERNLDAVALEIERIGEGQRFVTQLLAQKSGPAREALPEPRRDA